MFARLQGLIIANLRRLAKLAGLSTPNAQLAYRAAVSLTVPLVQLAITSPQQALVWLARLIVSIAAPRLASLVNQHLTYLEQLVSAALARNIYLIPSLAHVCPAQGLFLFAQIAQSVVPL